MKTLDFLRRFTTFLIMLITLSSYANEPAKVKFIPNSQTIIPGEIVSKSSKSIAAPIGDYHEAPIIKIFINKKGPYFFILATGSELTYISDKLAENLNLPVVQNFNKVDDTNAVHVNEKLYLADEMDIGGFVVKNYAILSTVLLDKDYLNTKAHVDGVLSANAFYGMLMTTDYRKENIHLEKGALNQDDKNVLKLIKSPVPTIQAQINFAKLKKQEIQNFVLNTYNFRFIYVNSCKIPELHQFEGKQGERLEDIDGIKSIADFAQLYGSIVLSESIIINSPYIHFGQDACNDNVIAGQFGKKFFETYKVTLDLENGLTRIVKY
ncbi:MAG: hypothetical protein JSR17_08895 [Proteobacteria bacterium]|nr:hypothetical protein [Pseudomonadota bacterium]